MAKTIYNMNEVGMREIVGCPKCGDRTHPECLTYVTATGQVVGCSTCVESDRMGREIDEP